ncbi:hypothetical protein ACSFA2_23670 [Variovorax sp. LT2P21]|uniref:zinc ribbon domain-containing protein n=1 Tax=Variovorax sp. LT2P21 TaxID=3443731 RepID=UPI003F457CF7
MFNAKSSTIACPECGQRNRAEARFCEACAARLGAEPSIASTRAPTRAPLPQATAPVPLAASAATGGDSRFDAPRTVHSRPMPLQAQAANNSGFWFKFCMAGLAVMIGFIAWSLYILTGSKAPTQLPAGQVSAEAPPVAASAAPAGPSAVPSPLPTSVAPSPSTAAATADAPPRSTSPTARAPRPSSTVPPAPPRQATARERVRPSPSEVRPADFGGWVEPSRPPAMTSSPNYQDAGPPVVAGPGPREPLATAPPAQPAGSVATTGRQDLGPPVSAGPGPRYDYSTPNAVGR